MNQLTIAIVTRNRPASLERTLRSIRAQAVQPDAIIISDDSDVACGAENQLLAERFSCGYQLGPKLGLYANRNAVARECTTSHFRTMDDDHEFPPGHFEACYSAISLDSEAIWIIGEYQGQLPVPAAWRPPCPGELHPRGFSVTPKDPQNCRAIACGATIYPRSVIERNILNVEDFPFGASYLEYGCRLAYSGYRIRHLSKTYIIHHIEEVGRSFPTDLNYEAANLFAMAALARYERRLSVRFLRIAEVFRRMIRRPVFTFRAHVLAERALGKQRAERLV